MLAILAPLFLLPYAVQCSTAVILLSPPSELVCALFRTPDGRRSTGTTLAPSLTSLPRGGVGQRSAAQGRASLQ